MCLSEEITERTEDKYSTLQLWIKNIKLRLTLDFNIAME